MSAAAPVSAAAPFYAHGGEPRRFDSEATRQLIAAFKEGNASRYSDALRALEGLADPDARDEEGRPLFFQVIESLEVPFVAAFLKAGANPNIIYTPSEVAEPSVCTPDNPVVEVHSTSPSSDRESPSEDILSKVFIEKVFTGIGRDRVFQKAEADKFMAIFLHLRGADYDINRPIFPGIEQKFTTFESMVLMAVRLRDTTQAVLFFKELVAQGAKLNTAFLTRLRDQEVGLFVQSLIDSRVSVAAPEEKEALRARLTSKIEAQVDMFGRVQRFIRDVLEAIKASIVI